MIKCTKCNLIKLEKEFKKEAEERGLIIDHAKTIGWSVGTLSKEEKLNRLYMRMEKLKAKIQKLEEGEEQ